jgi:hypothetical protein
MLGDDALDRAGHLIGAAASAGGYDKFNRTNRFPSSGSPDAARA